MNEIDARLAGPAEGDAQADPRSAGDRLAPVISLRHVAALVTIVGLILPLVGILAGTTLIGLLWASGAALIGAGLSVTQRQAGGSSNRPPEPLWLRAVEAPLSASHAHHSSHVPSSGKCVD